MKTSYMLTWRRYGEMGGEVESLWNTETFWGVLGNKGKATITER